MLARTSKVCCPLSESGVIIEQPRVNGMWRKGESGNPNGRRKKRTLSELCRSATEEVHSTLLYWLRQKEVPSASLKAAEMLLDRGYGKPVIPVADGSNHEALELDLEGLTDRQLANLEKAMVEISRRAYSIQDAPLIEAPTDNKPTQMQDVREN